MENDLICFQMSKMIPYICLFIPLLFLTTDSSSIRSRNHKNDLVPFLSSRLDTLKKDPNSMKIVSREPFIIQLQMPNSKEIEARLAKEKDKKRKRPEKKRVSKIKPLKKKHRKRRDLHSSKTKAREEKLIRMETPGLANKTESQLKNFTRNLVSRVEILRALSSYPTKTETKQSKPDKFRNLKNDEKYSTGKTKKNMTLNRSHHNQLFSASDRTKMAYPSTPKLDRHQQKYTYKDLMTDRERLEQKIKYLKNMLNDSITDDAIRVRRKSDSDRTANKIAKMFLTLSAVNGLHDRRKSKCNDEDDDDEDREQDVWKKEKRDSSLKKSTSSNEERYKVKKWIEFMKNKRSPGKICPCMANDYNEENDAFPLEHKLPKDYFLMERGRNSEESGELNKQPFYSSRDKPSRNDNIKKPLQDHEGKALSKNAKKRLELPFEDLELYRSRARHILRNAEEILDKIKEEEEKRLAAPNILMSQLKELTSRIQGDPRNNENDLIRKIQKNLGWNPLEKPQENADETFLDNVKSFILDPYEKAKALTDESTKKLSSYLLRNLGKLQDSSEEQEVKNVNNETGDGELISCFEDVPNGKEPISANLAKEKSQTAGLAKCKDLQSRQDTLYTTQSDGDDDDVKETNSYISQEPYQEMTGVIQKKEKELNDYKEQSTEKPENFYNDEVVKNFPSEKEIIAERKPDNVLKGEKVKLNEKETSQNNPVIAELQSKQESEDETVMEKVKDSQVAQEKASHDSDIVKNQKFREMEGTFQEKKGEDNVSASRNMQEEEEDEKKIEEIVKTIGEEETNTSEGSGADEVFQYSKAKENEETTNENIVAEVLKKQQDENEKLNTAEKVLASKEEDPNETASEERKPGDLTTDQLVGEKNYVSTQSIPLTTSVVPDYYELANPTEIEKNSEEILKYGLEKDRSESSEKSVVQKQESFNIKHNVDQLTVESTSDNLKDDLMPENDSYEEATPFVLTDLPKEIKTKDSSLNDEKNQKEENAKTFLEYADLVQEEHQESKELLEAKLSKSKLESDHQSLKAHEGEPEKKPESETLDLDEEENGDDEDIRNEKADEETLKAVLDEDVKEAMKEKANEKSSKETVDNQDLSDDVNDDNLLLKETNSDDQENEEPLLKEESNEATLKETLENIYLSKEEGHETSLSAEILTENMNNQRKTESKENDEDEAVLQESNLNVSEEDVILKTALHNQENQDSDAEDDVEIQEYNSSERNNKNKISDTISSNETYLKKDEELEKDIDKITVKAENPTDKEDETLRLNEEQETSFVSAKMPDVESQTEIQENDYEAESTDTSEFLGSQEKENLEKVDEGLTPVEENQKEQTINEEYDVADILEVENPERNLLKNKEQSQKTSSKSESREENLEQTGSEETLQESNFNEKAEDDENKNLGEKSTYENLQGISENQKQEILQSVEDAISQNELHSDTTENDENLKEFLDNETQEKLRGKTDEEESLKAVTHDVESERSQEDPKVEATLGNLDNNKELIDDTDYNEANNEELEQTEDNVNGYNHFRPEKLSEESEQKDKNEKNEDDTDKILLKAKEFDEDFNNQANQYSAERNLEVSSEENPEKLEGNEERLRKDNPNKQKKTLQSGENRDEKETSLISASFENDFENKLDEETVLKFAQSGENADDAEFMKEREETLQSENLPENLINQIDQINTDESQEALKPKDFDDDSEKNENGDDYELITAGNQEGAEDEPTLRASNPADSLQDEIGQFIFLGNDQNPDTSKKPGKTSKLKVPKSIGKIMKDLDGKEPYDITSIENLNPEKIDHMLDKIGKAEQQNLLESEEVDCKKECACAEEMNTRSRNIGRYEIVKDFLHWVKDLQLNRVLSDD